MPESKLPESKRESSPANRSLALRTVAVFTPAPSLPAAGPTLAQSAAQLRVDPMQLAHVTPSHFGPELLQALVEGCRRHLTGWEDSEIALALMGPKRDSKSASAPETALVRRLTDPAGLPDEGDPGYAFLLARRSELLGLMYGRMRLLKDRVAEESRLLNPAGLPVQTADARQALALRARALDRLYERLAGGLGTTLALNLASLETKPGHGLGVPQHPSARWLQDAARRAILKHLSEAQRLKLAARLSDLPPTSAAGGLTLSNRDALRAMRIDLYTTLTPAQRLQEAHRLCDWDSLPDDDQVHRQAIAGRAQAFQDLCGLLASEDRDKLLDSLCQHATLRDGGLERATDCALRVSLVRALRQGGLSTDRWAQDIQDLGTPKGVPQDEPRRSQTLALWQLAKS